MSREEASKLKILIISATNNWTKKNKGTRKWTLGGLLQMAIVGGAAQEQLNGYGTQEKR